MSDMSLSQLPDTSGGGEDAPRRRHSARRWRTAVVLVACLAVFGGAAWFGYAFVRPVVDGLLESDDYEGTGSGTVQVVVSSGDSGRAIARTLADADVVKSTGPFLAAVRDESAAASVQPGTYELRSQMSGESALALLLDPLSKVSLRVAVPEGFRAEQVYARVAEAAGVPVEEVEAAAEDTGALGLPGAAGGDPEGFLFPATYEFEPGTAPTAMLATMVDRAEQALETVGVPPARRRYVVTLASLVEAEARLPEDFGKVARVLRNRLDDGMPLQLDSTVNYVTGKTGITTTDADRATDSPYNTYVADGLPPGPISSPGEQAMAAALDPPPGPWRFFVTVDPDTGETRFAKTLAEHEKNVEVFQRWLRENE